MGPQGHPERGELRQIFQRPDRCRLRGGHLEGETVSGGASADLAVAAGREARAAVDAGGSGRPRARVLRSTARAGGSGAARQLRHQRPSGLAVPRHVHRGAHPGHHPGHLRLPPGAGDRRSALHGQGHPRRVRAGPAHRARGAGRQRGGHHHPARRRRHADAGHLARHPRLQPRARRRTWPTASSSRRRTTRPRTAASSTTRPTAAPPTPTSRAGSRTAPTHLLRRGKPASSGCRLRARIKAATTRQEDFVLPYVKDLAERHRHGARSAAPV